MTTVQALFWGPIVGGAVGSIAAWWGTKRVRRELKPNGGDSVKDQITAMQHQLDYVLRKLDKHIEFHLGKR